MDEIIYTINGELRIRVSIYEILEYFKNNKPTH